MKVSIIGTGNIGTDLLIKLLKSPHFEVVAFVGRRPSTKKLPDGVRYIENGIQFFIDNPRCCELVFECTDALSAQKHAQIFHDQDIIVVDLTPSKIGRLCVPKINSMYLENVKNVNMITCGGQVSIPLVKYLSQRCVISYAEVVTQISSESAGLATRINIDKYIETTEHAIVTIVGVPKCKVILNINPCPTTVMQTTVFVKTTSGDFSDFETFLKSMKSYVPYYEVSSPPTWLNPTTVMVSVNVMGSGDYLSKYAGNLDIINCASIEVARIFQKLKCPIKVINQYEEILDI